MILTLFTTGLISAFLAGYAAKKKHFEYFALFGIVTIIAAGFLMDVAGENNILLPALIAIVISNLLPHLLVKKNQIMTTGGFHS